MRRLVSFMAAAFVAAGLASSCAQQQPAAHKADPAVIGAAIDSLNKAFLAAVDRPVPGQP